MHRSPPSLPCAHRCFRGAIEYQALHSPQYLTVNMLETLHTLSPLTYTSGKALKFFGTSVTTP
jgi:hypothetical protein